MRHETDDVATFIANSGNVVHGPVGVADITQHNAPLGLEGVEGLGTGRVVPLEVVDGHPQTLTQLGPEVSADRSLTTSSSVIWHKNVRPLFFCKAPGSRCASVRT